MCTWRLLAIYVMQVSQCSVELVRANSALQTVIVQLE